MVNLKPIVPGHVLVAPRRTTAVELGSLSPEESQDYFRTVQLIQQFIKWQYKADALNIAIQDGPEAGQSVPHLHTHIIPRYKRNNYGDKVYEKIDEWQFRRDMYLGEGGRAARKAEEQEFKPDAQRVERGHDTMLEESSMLKQRLVSFLQEYPDLARKWA